MNILSIVYCHMRTNNINNIDSSRSSFNDIINDVHEYILINILLYYSNNSFCINVEEFINKNQNGKDISLEDIGALCFISKRNVSHPYNSTLDDTKILKVISNNKSYHVNIF
ncbi:hypothetical protein PFDG_05296 [Plasmodium falciparum Dd2]|uniref:Uncharacterized protein n=1 Tax=Plasmodium falciparum (isolate Dd2) TaxID=57267 RepID=A0A0L7MAA7_PLAF4|nr:hypothetical protein PFDG_05296 [Plasmodium falciparum Dd2]